ASGIIGLAFAGGSLLPLLFFAPFLWRPKTLLAGGAVILGTWLAMFLLWDNLGLTSAGHCRRSGLRHCPRRHELVRFVWLQFHLICSNNWCRSQSDETLGLPATVGITDCRRPARAAAGCS